MILCLCAYDSPGNIFAYNAVEINEQFIITRENVSPAHFTVPIAMT